MATKNIAATKLELNKAGEFAFTSVGSADNIYFDYTGADEKLVMLVSGAATITLKKGTAIQGVKDVTTTVSTYGAIRVDSGLFKATETDAETGGAVKGKIKVATSATVNVALIQLP